MSPTTPSPSTQCRHLSVSCRRLYRLTEITEYTTYPWCRKCRRSQKETAHKSNEELGGGPFCDSYSIWMSQPARNQTGPCRINKELYCETIPFFRQASIFHHKPTLCGQVLFYKRISDNLQTLKAACSSLACLSPRDYLSLDMNAFLRLKTIILPEKLLSVPFSLIILRAY